MGTSALEILIIPVLWGTLRGIVAGAALLLLWDAVLALIGQLGRAARSLAAPPRAAGAAPRPARRPVVRDGHALGAYG